MSAGTAARGRGAGRQVHGGEGDRSGAHVDEDLGAPDAGGWVAPGGHPQTEAALRGRRDEHVAAAHAGGVHGEFLDHGQAVGAVAAEGERLLKTAAAGTTDRLVALDPGGEALDSAAWAALNPIDAINVSPTIATNTTDRLLRNALIEVLSLDLIGFAHAEARRTRRWLSVLSAFSAPLREILNYPNGPSINVTPVPFTCG